MIFYKINMNELCIRIMNYNIVFVTQEATLEIMLERARAVYRFSPVYV